MKKQILCVLGLNCLLISGLVQAAAIHRAVGRKDLPTVKEHVKKDPGVVNLKDRKGQTPLHEAVDEKWVVGVRFFIRNKADVNAKDRRGWTPLHEAADEESVDIAEILIQAGADVNAKDRRNWTPLHEAVDEESVGVAQKLIDAGAEVDAKDNRGRTPLSLAHRKQLTEMINLLESAPQPAQPPQ